MQLPQCAGRITHFWHLFDFLSFYPENFLIVRHFNRIQVLKYSDLWVIVILESPSLIACESITNNDALPLAAHRSSVTTPLRVLENLEDHATRLGLRWQNK